MISLEKNNAGTAAGTAAVTPAPSDTVFTAAQYTPLRKKFAVSPHDSAFAWTALVLGFLFVRYAVFYTGSFATTGCFILLHIFCRAYLKRSGCQVMFPQKIMSAVILALSTVFSISASPLLHHMCFWFLFAAQAWQMTAAGCGIPFVSRYLLQDGASAMLHTPFSNMGAGRQSITESVKRSGTATGIRNVVIGILVTIPLTAVVGSLLASADPGVEKILTGMLNMITEDMVTVLFQMLLGIPAGFFLFGMAYGGAHRREDPLLSDAARAEKLESMRIVPNAALYAGVTPICILYLLYFWSQMNYFVSAFFGRLPENMIYSEYARRGFFELCWIAVINLAVILLVKGLAKNHEAKALRFYACTLCGCTLFIIATALAKMFLYIEAYGLTRLRLYTSWFMLLMAVVFLVLTVRQFVRIPTSAILTVAFTGLFTVLCFARPDALIAEYNLSRYENGTLSELDINALTELSADAYVVMVRHEDTILNADECIRERYLTHLRNYQNRYELHPDASWNIPAQLLLQKG